MFILVSVLYFVCTNTFIVTFTKVMQDRASTDNKCRLSMLLYIRKLLL